MELPEEGQQDVWKSADDLGKVFDMQISRNMDYVRAKQHWSRVLPDMPLAALTEALARLSSGRYQLTPGCRCCNRRH